LCLYALHYLGNVEAAEDVVQESEVINTRAYLYMTVRNRCLDQLKAKGLATESLKPYDTYGIIDEDEAEDLLKEIVKVQPARLSATRASQPLQFYF
jgi:RNA polymerase sigma-70 factor (ECF subfamily)